MVSKDVCHIKRLLPEKGDVMKNRCGQEEKKVNLRQKGLVSFLERKE